MAPAGRWKGHEGPSHRSGILEYNEIREWAGRFSPGLVRAGDGFLKSSQGLARRHS